MGTDWLDMAGECGSASPSRWVLTNAQWVEMMNELVSKTFPEASTPFLSLSPLCGMLRGHMLRVAQMKGTWISEWPCRVRLHLPSLLTTLA